jgi:hypothetical protein
MKYKWFLIIGLFFLILLAYGWYNNKSININGVNVIGYAYKKSGYQMGRYEEQWKFIYEYKNKPYFAFITGKNIEYGSKYLLKINALNPTRHNDIKLIDDKKKTKKIIFYGKCFNNCDSLVVCLNSKTLLCNFSFNQDFITILPFRKKYTIKIFRKKILMALYDFEFDLNSVELFYVIKLKKSLNRLHKRVKFNKLGDFSYDEEIIHHQ